MLITPIHLFYVTLTACVKETILTTPITRNNPNLTQNHYVTTLTQPTRSMNQTQSRKRVSMVCLYIFMQKSYTYGS